MTVNTPTVGKIKGKDIARFVLLPEILPRAKALGGTGFAYLAFLIANVYRAVRILPAGHPFTLVGNMGKFGIRQVIAAAADNVILDRKHIDQIIIFLAVLVAIILLAFQFLGIIILLFSGQAFAGGGAGAGGDFLGMFTTTKPEHDIAFMLLDYIFGIPKFFGSAAIAAGSTPFHNGLHTLFNFYNLALLIVAVLIFLYYVVVVVAETALHGTPFGRRFNTVYAPLRLVFAIGLLVPLNYGFNASQYIVLGAARAGSGMATNGWLLFNRNLTNPMGAENAKLVAEPNAPIDYSLNQFLTVARACQKAYEFGYNKDVKIDAYIINEANPILYSETDYATARNIFKGGSVEVVFGHKGDSQDHKNAGGVIPYCGKISIPVSVSNPSMLSGGNNQGGNTANNNNWTGNGGEEIGPELIQARYYWLAKFIWERPFIESLGWRMAYAHRLSKPDPCYGSSGRGSLGDNGSCKTSYKPPSAIKDQLSKDIQFYINTIVKEGVDTARQSADYKIDEEILKRGWGGAGIWYNKIAELNGAISDAALSLPSVSKWPMLMESVKSQKTAQDKNMEPCDRFSASLADGIGPVQPNKAIDLYITRSTVSAYRYWYCDQTTEQKGLTANIFWDAMHIIFGTGGLFSLRDNADAEIHPLAQLTAIGKTLVENSIRNMAYSMGTAVVGGFLGAIAQHWGAPVQAMSSFFVSIAMIGLTAGFILYYILPFLPFIYFFFAVGAWIKTIFEAMVGAPLWALAHLRIDGDGFPGRSAANGYFLIFEIFIRPILTVFGLLGGMAVFTAMAVILNDMFDFVVFQVTGTELGSKDNAGGSVYTGEYEEFRRSIVDEFFFTVLYAILLYMMGLASFKMIDLVPNNILRWMGAGVSTFADQAGDPKEGLVQYAAIGGYQIGGQLVGAMNKAGGAVGTTAGAIINIGQQQQENKP